MHLSRLAVAAVLLTACSSSSKSGDQPGGGGGDAGTTSAALNCAALLNCAAACNDDACSNACVASGSTEAQQTANDLAQCYQDNSCSDAACLKAHCETQLDACFSQGQPTGTPLGTGTAPAGDVPASLVGSWAVASYGATQRFVFNADGTGYYQTAVTQDGSCLVTQETVWKGTAVLDDTTITIYATTVTNSRHECGQVEETSSDPATLHFTYNYDSSADTLGVLDSDCAAQYPDSPESANLYCKNTLSRE